MCSLSSKLWNEVNYARKRMFFETKRVDLKETYREFYEKYKVLTNNIGEIRSTTEQNVWCQSKNTSSNPQKVIPCALVLFEATPRFGFHIFLDTLSPRLLAYEQLLQPL